MPENYAGKEDRFWAKYIVEKNKTYLYNQIINVIIFGQRMEQLGRISLINQSK